MKTLFTFDAEKAALNLKKHGVQIEIGAEVFSDPFHVLLENIHDPQTDELRYVAIGRALNETVLAVIHVERSTETQIVIHLISVRKADSYEEKLYSIQFA